MRVFAKFAPAAHAAGAALGLAAVVASGGAHAQAKVAVADLSYKDTRCRRSSPSRCGVSRHRARPALTPASRSRQLPHPRCACSSKREDTPHLAHSLAGAGPEVEKFPGQPLKFFARHPIKGVLISEMAMQLSSSSVSSTAAAGASGGGSSSATDIERLQRQLKNLQKSMANLPNQGLPPEQAREQAQLLSQQIQIVQAQIARLQAQKGLEQAETQLESRHNASKNASGAANTDAAAKAHTTDKVTGSSTLSDARLQARQATQASAHPASAEAITPAEPPLVSVRA